METESSKVAELRVPGCVMKKKKKTRKWVKVENEWVWEGGKEGGGSVQGREWRNSEWHR